MVLVDWYGSWSLLMDWYGSELSWSGSLALRDLF